MIEVIILPIVSNLPLRSALEEVRIEVVPIIKNLTTEVSLKEDKED